MKKKSICFVLLGCLAFAALAGCSLGEKNDVYSTLNQLAAKTPQSLALEPSVTADGETLKGEYEVVAEEDGYRVTYSYEKLSLFTEEDGTYPLPEEYKQTVEGEMLVSDGKIVEQNGEAADLSIEQITASGVRFSAPCFTDVEQAEGSFQANVSDPSAFLQEEFSCTGMTVEVTYGETISAMKISYTSQGGAQVVLEYTFS